MKKFLITFLAVISIAGLSYSKELNYEELTYAYDSIPEEYIPDVFPAYPGGLKGVMNYLCENISYPKAAYKQNIQGRVMVKFVINVNGEVSDTEIVESVHPLLDAEAVRVLTSMTGFKPAVKNGENIPFWYCLPVSFTITK